MESKNNSSKNIFIGAGAVVLLVIAIGLFFYFSDNSINFPNEVQTGFGDSTIKSFSSYDELYEYLNKSALNSMNFYYGEGVFVRTGAQMVDSLGERAVSDMAAGIPALESSSSKSSDYSATNIQVEGVDEADIVKTDGEYIYYVVGNSVYIFKAYPSEEMELLSNISSKGYISDIFINDNLLVVFSNDYSGRGYGATDVFVYDVSDREMPELYQNYSFEGNYQSSRMIGDYVYIISTKYIYNYRTEPIVFYEGDLKREVAASDIYYFGYPENNYIFNVISSIDLNSKDAQTKVFLTGGSGVIYSSADNIYLSSSKNMQLDNYFDRFYDEVLSSLLPREERNKVLDIIDTDDYFYIKEARIGKVIFDYSSSLKGEGKANFDKELEKKLADFEISISKEREKTVFHKININKGDIEYVSSGGVSGRLLNQFSMDEYEGNFRVVTTTGNSWNDNSLNHLFVLDDDMKVIGSVEDLAKGERVYSARFMGDKAYIVTFKNIDPLFVIDLSNPKNPEVLGYLKIPGFSSYLHPVGESHLLGIGMDIDEETGRTKGLKISLFDISDFENPKEESTFVVDKTSIYSEALYNHKAVLYDADRGVLAIPVGYYEDYDERTYYYGKHTSSVLVFEVERGREIEFVGEIKHDKKSDDEKEYYYWNNIQRALYIDDVFYTLSETTLQANDFYSLEKLGVVIFREIKNDYWLPYISSETSVEVVLKNE
jgi:inhibitor of cysteine peptidase